MGYANCVECVSSAKGSQIWRFGGCVAFLMIVILAGCSDNPARFGDSHNPLSPDPSGPSSSFGGEVDCDELPVAPESLRVDLITPVFTNPTDAFNPLFPVGELDRALFLGQADGESFRSETTRFSSTKTIILDGKPVETIISQYVAWVDRRIDEVAFDWYGQDDEGNVWYFGEDVFNYEDGVVVDTEGTWLAGRDGPVAMIMPADPQVGNVWRPENACPLVFEEVTALETGVVVDGPNGPVGGALLVQELHMDETYEDKTFAPGYGEFSTGAGANAELLAVAVPTDFIGGGVPEDLDDLSDHAERMFVLSRGGNWGRIASLFAEMEENWEDYEATSVPPGIAGAMNEAMDDLGEAIEERDRKEVRQSAVDVALSCVDFELRHEERGEIDLDLIEVWTLQLRIDAAARDAGAIRSDLETIRVIRDRLTRFAADRIDGDLVALRAASETGDERALTIAVGSLQVHIAGMTRSSR